MRDSQILEVFATGIQGAPVQRPTREFCRSDDGLDSLCWRVDMKLYKDKACVCCYTWITTDHSFKQASCDVIRFNYLASPRNVTILKSLEELEHHLAIIRKAI